MYKKKSLKINFMYSFLLNIINILFPLLISPYVSRVLGADNIGKYNFSVSFSNWFLIFATFGTTTYGIREIAKVREDRELLNKTFTEIFIINFISTIITLIVYLIVIFYNTKTNAEIIIFIISAVSLFLNLFCIDWLYMGLEEFKNITIRSLLIKVFCLIGVFIFVKNKEDYTIYALISTLAFGFANILNFIYSKKFVNFDFKNLNIRKHISQLLLFLYSSLTISVYSLFDQVFLGFFSTSKDVAFFSRARQIYSISLSLTLAISTVLLPKLTYLFKYDIEEYKKILKKSIDYIYIFSIPCVFGIVILAKEIMWLFGGDEFKIAYKALIILSILIFTVALGNWQYNQIIIPLGKEKVGLKVQMIMAGISLISNIFLVPLLGYIGASISLVITEIIGTIYGVFYIKRRVNEVNIIYVTKSLIKYSIASIIMIIAIIIFKLLEFGYIYNIIFGVIVGPIIYFIVLIILKEEICLEGISYLLFKLNLKAYKNYIN